MKKKILLISSMAIILLLSLIRTSFAAPTATATLNVSSKNVKKGETFTVTLAVECEDGINGISTKYTYDNSVLELQKEEIVDSSKWSSLGSSGNIEVICNSVETIKSAEIYKITFKVKDTVNVGDILTIGTSAIEVDSDLPEDSKVSLSAKVVLVNVIGEENNNEGTPDKDGETPGDENVPNGTTGNADGNNTDEDMPDTGVASTTLAIIALIVVAVISYTSYSKYRNI